MLKSPKTKYRRLKNRLFISILTITLLFSYSLKNNEFKALTGTPYNAVYDWGSVHYGALMQTAMSTTSQLMIFDIQFNGVYNGTMNINFGSILQPAISIEPFNCAISSIGTQSIQLKFTNTNMAYVMFYQNSSSALNVSSITTNLTKLTDGVPYLVERINSKMNDVKQSLIDLYNRTDDIRRYVDNVETLLTSLSNSVNSYATVLNTISTNTSNILSDTNSLVTYTTTLTQYLTTLHNDNGDIVNAINNIDLNPTGTQINIINNYETQLDIVNNIEGNLIADLDNEIVTNKKGYEYIRDVIKNSAKHNEAKSILDIYTNEFKGAWNADQYIFNDISWYILMAIAFALIRVVIG